MRTSGLRSERGQHRQRRIRLLLAESVNEPSAEQESSFAA